MVKKIVCLSVLAILGRWSGSGKFFFQIDKNLQDV